MGTYLLIGKMNRIDYFEPYFCDSIPSELAPGVLYISMNGRLAMHLCPCGCGEVVVTSFAPGHWKLYFDGESVGMSPSIGNYNFKCQSHYFIRNNRVKWCKDEAEDESSKRKCSRKRKRILRKKNKK